jgi:hypothetical protein
LKEILGASGDLTGKLIRKTLQKTPYLSPKYHTLRDDLMRCNPAGSPIGKNQNLNLLKSLFLGVKMCGFGPWLSPREINYN